MKSPSTGARMKWSAIALIVAGVFFVLYPALRPFSDEVSLQGAAAFASPYWLAAHMLAMIAFSLLVIGLLGLHEAMMASQSERGAYAALVLGILGVGLTLPFYGGEANGLHAIGQEALRQQDAGLLSLAAVIRGAPGLYMFLIGLLLLAASGIVAAVTLWRADDFPKWSGVPFAVALALYIPQFFGTQPLRVAHGVLLAIGCFWIAAILWRHGNRDH